MELLKLLSASEIVAQIISFLILFFILRSIAWKKILKLLDDRKERIANEFKNIENNKLELANIKADYENKLSNIDERAKNAVKEAVKEGVLAAESIRKQAYYDADKIIKDAKVHVGIELEKAKEKLKDEIIDLTIDATSYVIRERMDDEHDKKLIADFIERIDGVK